MGVKGVNTEEETKKLQIKCKFFASGNCRNGYNCRFLHVRKDGSFEESIAETKSKENEIKSCEQTSSKEADVTNEKENSKSVNRRYSYYARRHCSRNQAGFSHQEAEESLPVNEQGGEDSKDARRLEMKPAPCRFYARGCCLRGNTCHFLHEKVQSRRFAGAKISVSNSTEASREERGIDEQGAVPPEHPKPAEGKSGACQNARRDGVKNFLNDRKSYLRQFNVPKFVRESRRFVSRPKMQRSAADSRRAEILLLMQKFPDASKVDGDSFGTACSFTFIPSDPDWVFDVKEFKMVAELPESYPVEPMRVHLSQSAAVPGPVTKDMNDAINAWMTTKRESLDHNESLLRNFFKWFDQNLEEILASALKQYKRELVLAASGIQIISAEQLRAKYKGAVQRSEVADDTPPAAGAPSKAVPENEPGVKNDDEGGRDDDDDDGDDDENDDGDDDEEEDEDDELVINPSNAVLAEPVKRGTEARLNGLELSGIATLLCSRLKVTMACGRCTNKMDVGVTIPNQSNSAMFSVGCPFCSNKGSALFNRGVIHALEHCMGCFDLDGCHVVDVLLNDCEFRATCFKCMKELVLKSLFPGQQSDTWCMDCHQKMSVKINNVKIMRLQSNLPQKALAPKASAQVETDRRPKSVKDPAIQDGKPLPMFGTCKHFKKSFRWFRFPCCGKAYPCDVCHEEAESHEMKLANRIICGFCALEQTYSPSNPCARCGGHVTNKFTPHWEGGKGCRDRVKMSRLDSKKYSNSSKTVSTTLKNKQGQNKVTKLRHAQ